MLYFFILYKKVGLGLLGMILNLVGIDIRKINCGKIEGVYKWLEKVGVFIGFLGS